MDKRLLTLRLVLNELSIPVDVSSIDNRKTMQKAVYLAQAVGVPLGYRFNWYVMGPYSPGLTDDYYTTAAEGGDLPDRALRSDYRDRLGALKSVLDLAPTEGMSRADWLELLASWLYRRVTAYEDPETAKEMMDRVKPRLAPKAGVAERILQQAGLLPAQGS